MKKSIKKLQEADEGTKTIWLWGLTVLSGLTVFLLWTGYLYLTVEKINYSADAGQSDSGFFSTLTAGLLSIRTEASDGLHFLMREKFLEIKAPVRNFVYRDLEKIKTIQLP